MAGLLSFGAALGPETGRLLDGLGAALAHRGPDDERHHHLEQHVGLVSRRIATVDVRGGTQPLVSPDGTLVAMVNGEIYNHHELRARLRGSQELRTGSDSELVLPLYREHGLGFLDHLCGMYAIAIWDRREQQLVLARDRLGIKPMHYAHIGDRLVFATELKALFVHPGCPRDLDWDAALSAAFGHRGASAGSCFEGIATLPAGSALVVDARRGTVATSRYWTLPARGDDPSDRRTESQIVDGYREVLEDAVDKCVGGDAEVGLFLGGGVDAMAVATLASRRRDVHAFSMVSPRTKRDAAAARRVTDELGLPAYEVRFDPALPISVEGYASVLWACETPWIGPEQLCRDHLHRHVRAMRPALKAVLLPHDDLLTTMGEEPVDPDEHTWDGFERALRGAERDALLERLRPGALYARPRSDRPLFSHAWLAELARPRPRAGAPTVAQDEHLAHDDLWSEDRTASANGIEARVPFLDHRLVEYAMRIPERFHRALLRDHVLLRRACIPLLPAGVVVRTRRLDDAVTARWILDLLESDQGALIEEACIDGTIDRRAARRVASDARSDLDGTVAQDLLHVLNMGLLARLARDLPRPTLEPQSIELRDRVATPQVAM